MQIIISTLFIFLLNGIILMQGVESNQQQNDLTTSSTINEDGCVPCDDDCELGNKKDNLGCDICGVCETDGIVEGDILLSNDSYSEYVRLYSEEPCADEQDRSVRGAITGDRFKWPKSADGNVYVPFIFLDNISSRKRERIQTVFREYQQKTCIRFTRRTNEQAYLRIDGTGGCSSYVGRQAFRNGQVVKIGNGCDNAKGTIIHELMHALGFWHEQSRGDRDSHIEVLFQNIREGAEGNFKKQYNFEAYNTQYDITSVMHYGGSFFSKNGQPTIVERRTRRPIRANRRDFSSIDLIEINRRYDCKQFLGGNRPASTASPTTTQRPAVAGTCQDVRSNCEFWVRQNYCTQDYISFMRTNCAKSCGFCRTATQPPTRPTARPVTTRTTQRPSVCVNKYSGCRQLINRCTAKGTWESFMRTNCAALCGFCGATTTVRPTVARTTQSPNCRDRNSNCNYWRERNYCTSGQFQNFMRQSCRRTCGLCGNVVSGRRPIATSAPDNSQCGKVTTRLTSRSLVHRIVGGSEAEYGTVPWIVSLRKNRDYDYCAGSLINDRFVLTAAHCFYEGKTFNSRVDHMHGYVGKHQRRGSNRDQFQQRVTFKRVIKHPSYNHDTSNNDIALLELRNPVQFNDYVKPICLPRSFQPAIPSTVGKIAGWGETEKEGFPDVLHHVNVEVISNDNCNRWLRRHFNRGRDEVNSNMFCAGYQRGGRDACQGDSGGPLTIQKSNGAREIWGVISWGYGCADVERPGVYAKVSNYISWINRSMNSS